MILSPDCRHQLAHTGTDLIPLGPISHYIQIIAISGPEIVMYIHLLLFFFLYSARDFCVHTHCITLTKPQSAMTDSRTVQKFVRIRSDEQWETRYVKGRFQDPFCGHTGYARPQFGFFLISLSLSVPTNTFTQTDFGWKQSHLFLDWFLFFRLQGKKGIPGGSRLEVAECS